VVRTCDICGCEYEAKRKDSRACSATCRKRKGRGAGPAPVPAAATSAAAGEPAKPISLVEATRLELTAAGKADTVLGQLALSLAGRLSGSVTGIAALSKEFRAVKAEALGEVPGANPAPGTGDTVDELRARRNAKRAG
jgi:hypothetical protein